MYEMPHSPTSVLVGLFAVSMTAGCGTTATGAESGETGGSSSGGPNAPTVDATVTMGAGSSSSDSGPGSTGPAGNSDNSTTGAASSRTSEDSTSGRASTTTTEDSTTGGTSDDSTTASTSSETTDDSTTGGTSSETSDGSTTGDIDPCDALPAGPILPTEFAFAGSPLDGNSEDMTFTSNGEIVARDGDDLVRISAAGTVTPFVTATALPDTLGLRWSPSGTVVTATIGTGELLELDNDGTVTTLWPGLTLPNGVFIGLDGTVFLTDFLDDLVAYVDPSGASLVTLASGGATASQANGVLFDPVHEVVYYNTYGDGEIYRVDLTDPANPGPPQLLATIVSEGVGDGVGLDGLAMDTCGNLYIVDQNQGDPGSLYRLSLDDAGDPLAPPELLAEFPENVANVVFAQGPGWDAYATHLFAVGVPGHIYVVDVGIGGAPTPAQ